MVAHFLYERISRQSQYLLVPPRSELIACYLTFRSSNARQWMSEVHWHTQSHQQPTRKAYINENREALTHERRLRNTNSVVIISLPQLQLANKYTIDIYIYV